METQFLSFHTLCAILSIPFSQLTNLEFYLQQHFATLSVDRNMYIHIYILRYLRMSNVAHMVRTGDANHDAGVKENLRCEIF